MERSEVGTGAPLGGNANRLANSWAGLFEGPMDRYPTEVGIARGGFRGLENALPLCVEGI